MSTFSQKAIWQDYNASSALKAPGAREALHRFFSPNHPPLGLTDQQIETCLALHARRRPLQRRIEEQRRAKIEAAVDEKLGDDYLALEHVRNELAEVFGDEALTMSAKEIGEIAGLFGAIALHPIPLPRQLTHSEMTAERFVEGVAELQRTLDELEHSGASM